MPERATYTVSGAASAVGVSRRTIYNWIAAGRLEYVRTAGGSIRIFADSLWRPADANAGDAGDSRQAGQETVAPVLEREKG